MAQSNPYAQFGYDDEPQASPAPGGVIPGVRPAPQPQTSNGVVYTVTPDGRVVVNGTLPQQPAPPPAPPRPGEVTEGQQRANQLTQRFNRFGSFSRVVDEIERLYQDNLQGSNRGGVLGFGGDRNLRSRLPLAPTGYETFDVAGRRLIDQIKQAYGLTGGEANQVQEIETRFGPYIPSSSDSDQTIESKLRSLRALIEEERQGVAGQMQAAGIAVPQSPDNNAGSRIDRTQQQIIDGTNAPQRQISGGDTQADPNYTPISLATRQRLSNMLKGGAPDDEVRRYARDVGMSDQSINQALQWRQTPAYREWRRQRPNEMWNFRDDAPRNVPMGFIDGGAAWLAGSGPGAAVGNYANAVVPLAAVANENRARTALDASRAEHPGWSLAGQVGGAATSYALGGAAANALAGKGTGALARFLRTPDEFAALTPRSIAGDALYGAEQGWGENGDPLSGAGAGVVGGMFGRAAPRALASTVSPTGGPLAQIYAESRNFRPTPGQRFRGTGWVGDAVNMLEEAASGVPGLGRYISNAREGARREAQGTLWDRVLGRATDANGEPFRLPAGVRSGVEAQRVANDAVNDIYDRARSNLTFRLDGDWSNDLANIQRARDVLPADAQRRFDTVFEREVGRRIRQGGGSLAGREFKTATSQIDTEINTLRRNPQQNGELIAALEQVDDALHAGARRHSTPEAVQLLDQADSLFSGVAPLQSAASRRLGGANADPADFSGSDILQVSRNEGARGGRFLRGETQFFDEARRMQQLEDVLPSSGTSERTAVMSLPERLQQYGAQYGPTAALGTAAGGATYLGVDPKYTAAITALPFLGVLGRGALAPRGAAAPIAAEWLRRRSRLGGMFGAPLMLEEARPEPGY